MVYIIGVFRSRKETMDFKGKLECNCVRCHVINTPRKVSVGCGVSVKFDIIGYTCARHIINSNTYRTFHGFYRYNSQGELELM